MKITVLTAEDLELKEGGASGIAIGVALVLGGILFAVVAHNGLAMATIAGLGLAVAGLLLILFSTSITVSANQRNGQLRYEKKRLVGAQQTMYSIADVFKIETRKQWRTQDSTDSEGNSTRETRLVAQSIIVFRDGKQLPLCHEKNASRASAPGGGAQIALAMQVAQFLNVPFQEVAP